MSIGVGVGLAQTPFSNADAFWRWVQLCEESGVDSIWQHDQQLVAAMLDGITGDNAIPNLTLFGPPDANHRCSVFSIRIEGYDAPQSLSDVLEERFNILSRSGIHCAPLAHKTIGTHHLAGTTRLSFGPFITVENVNTACRALAQVAAQTAAV